MKRITTFALSIVLAATIHTQSQNFSHWSLTLETGTNVFDGDLHPNYDGILQNAIKKPSFGGTLEYNFNPAFGMGLAYYYRPVQAKDNNASFTSVLQQFYPYFALNLLHLNSNSIHTKWGIWGTVGLGYTQYNSNLIIQTGTSTIKSSNPEGGAITIPVGILLEYNFSHSLALDAKLQYCSHNADNLEGGTAGSQYNFEGVSNDFLITSTIGLRWKLVAKRKQHVRNINWDTFRPDESLSLTKDLKEEMTDLQKRVGKVEDRVNVMEPLLASMKMLFDKEGPDTDEDGVPDQRDMDNNTLTNTPVDFWGRTLGSTVVIRNQAPISQYVEVQTVYFQPDQLQLQNDGLATIRLVAERMLSEPDLMLETRGYCDYTGTVNHNQKLSLLRAERVKKELVEVYGISADRIVTNGKGRILNPGKSYSVNRRVEFHFSN